MKRVLLLAVLLVSGISEIKSQSVSIFLGGGIRKPFPVMSSADIYKKGFGIDGTFGLGVDNTLITATWGTTALFLHQPIGSHTNDDFMQFMAGMKYYFNKKATVNHIFAPYAMTQLGFCKFKPVFEAGIGYRLSAIEIGCFFNTVKRADAPGWVPTVDLRLNLSLLSDTNI
ncbi:MAG: hypothetical protein L6Q81_16150 [Bacteroidia bacterium]|nr:hypothetical protein [Bacteroidia bacterium]